IRTSARADLESHRHLTVVCPRAKVPTPREVPNMDGDQVAEESQSRSQRQRRDRGDQRRGEAELLKRDEVHEAGADADEAPQDDEEAHGELPKQMRRLRWHGVSAGAVGVHTILLRDIDDTDQTLQFRFRSNSKVLKESLKRE